MHTNTWAWIRLVQLMVEGTHLQGNGLQVAEGLLDVNQILVAVPCRRSAQRGDLVADDVAAVHRLFLLDEFLLEIPHQPASLFAWNRLEDCPGLAVVKQMLDLLPDGP